MSSTTRDGVEWRQTMMGKDQCPQCGRLCDAASDPHGRHIPAPGDLSVCAYCAALLQFGSDMALMVCPEAVIRSLDECTLRDIRKYQAAVRDLINIRR